MRETSRIFSHADARNATGADNFLIMQKMRLDVIQVLDVRKEMRVMFEVREIVQKSAKTFEGSVDFYCARVKKAVFGKVS